MDWSILKHLVVCTYLDWIINRIERSGRDLINERVNASVEFRRKTGGDLGGRPKTSNKRKIGS